MNFPKITFNNYNDGNNINSDRLKFDLPNKKIKIKSKKLIDDFISTNKLNNIKYCDKKLLPLKLKKINMVLPLLTNRPNNSKANKDDNYNNICKSTINDNKKYIKRRVNDLYYFYHPWLNNSYNKHEINSYMSNCYDITKIDTRINENKYRINNSKLTNKLLRDVEKHHKIANLFNKKKVNINDIKYNKNMDIRNNLNTIDAIIQTDHNDIKPLNKYDIDNSNFYEKKNNLKNNLRIFRLLDSENKSHSLENTHLIPNKKFLRKNITNSKNEYFLKDFIMLSNTQKQKISSSLNNSLSNISNKINEDYKNNNPCLDNCEADNNSKLKNNYKTIKIKKLIKNSFNDKYNDEKNNRVDKIKSNLLFKKNITFYSLYSENKTQPNVIKNSEINNLKTEIE